MPVLPMLGFSLIPVGLELAGDRLARLLNFLTRLFF